MRSWIPILLACPLTACDDDGPRMEAEVYEDNGTLCLLQDGVEVRIYALSGACNCSSIRSTTCSTVAGDASVVISSRTLVVTNVGADIVCPTGCDTQSVSCSGAFPREGQFEVKYGSEQAVVGLPLSGPLQLFGPYPSSYCDNLVETLERSSVFEPDAAP